MTQLHYFLILLLIYSYLLTCIFIVRNCDKINITINRSELISFASSTDNDYQILSTIFSISHPWKYSFNKVKALRNKTIRYKLRLSLPAFLEYFLENKNISFQDTNLYEWQRSIVFILNLSRKRKLLSSHLFHIHTTAFNHLFFTQFVWKIRRKLIPIQFQINLFHVVRLGFLITEIEWYSCME